MAFPSSLAPAARSAYRSVMRAARVTFQNDPARFAQMMSAVRPTFESPTLTNPAKPPPVPLEGPAPDLSSPEEISKRIEEWNEVALFLRKNVVQGTLDQDSGRYKLRLTEDTEIGSNDSVKTPEPMPVTPFPNRNKSRRRTPVTKCGE